MSRGNRGFALLEVVLALAILALAGTSLVQVAAAGTRALDGAGRRTIELADEDRLMTAYALLDRRGLDLRLGRTAVGSLLVEVQRPEPELYRVAIGRVDSPDKEDLVTVLRRARPAGEP